MMHRKKKKKKSPQQSHDLAQSLDELKPVCSYLCTEGSWQRLPQVAALKKTDPFGPEDAHSSGNSSKPARGFFSCFRR